MKRFLLTAILSLVTVFSVNAQVKTDNKTNGGTQAEITFVTKEHDYGTIEKGANGDCEFVYKNTGKAPLMLTSVKSTCGCTIPKWSKEPLMPGQTAVIRVHYDTKRVGSFTKTINVDSNAGNAQQGRVQLTIKGKVQ